MNSTNVKLTLHKNKYTWGDQLFDMIIIDRSTKYAAIIDTNELIDDIPGYHHCDDHQYEKSFILFDTLFELIQNCPDVINAIQWYGSSDYCIDYRIDRRGAEMEYREKELIRNDGDIVIISGWECREISVYGINEEEYNKLETIFYKLTNKLKKIDYAYNNDPWYGDERTSLIIEHDLKIAFKCHNALSLVDMAAFKVKQQLRIGELKWNNLGVIELKNQYALPDNLYIESELEVTGNKTLNLLPFDLYNEYIA